MKKITDFIRSLSDKMSLSSLTAAHWTFLFFFFLLGGILFLTGCHRDKDTPPVPSLPQESHTEPESSSNTPPQTENEIPQDPESAGIKPLRGVTAGELFRDVINVYHNAKVYSDDGYIEKINEINGAPVTERTPCRITFRQPNFIRMEISNGILTSDGEKMRGEIFDPFYKKQFLEKPAPLLFSSIKDLYPDVTLAQAMDLPIPQNIFWTPPQLILLLAQEPLKTFAPSGELKLLAPAYYRLTEDDGFETLIPCDRIAVTAEDGTRTFWISRKNKRILKIDLPIEQIQVPEGVQRVLSLAIHFPHLILSDEVTLDSPFDSSSFTLDRENRTICDHFSPLEISIGGQPFPDIRLTPIHSGDSPILLHQPSERIRVLALWRNQAGKPELWNQSRALLQELDAAARMFKKEDKIDFLAVNVDSPQKSNVSVISDYSEAAFSFPLYRLNPEDLEETPLADLKKPSIIFLDRQGLIQKYYTFPISYVSLQFQLVLLRDGKNIFQNEADSFEKTKENFKKLLDAAVQNDIYLISPDSSNAELKIAEEAKPSRFHLTQAWRTDLLDPGNPLIIAEGQEANQTEPEPFGSLIPPESVLIPYAGNMIAVLSADGKVIFRKPTEASEPVSVLRTLKTADGKRYLAASSFRDTHKIHLYNDRFESPGVLDVQSRRQWVADFLLTDDDHDKKPEIIMGLLGDPVSNFIPIHGIYAIDIGEDGNCPLLWKDEYVINPCRLGFIHRCDEDGMVEKILLAMNSPVDNMGKLIEDDLEGGRRMHIISPPEDISIQWFVSPFQQESNETEAVAALLTRTGTDETSFALLDSEGKPIQETPLSGATWNNHMERIIYCGSKEDVPFQWVIPTREGVIYFFDSQGILYDKMAVGSEVTGAGLARWQSGNYLIVASPTRLTAYRIEGTSQIPQK